MVCSGATVGAPRWATTNGRAGGCAVTSGRTVSRWTGAPRSLLVPRGLPAGRVGSRPGALPDPVPRGRARADGGRRRPRAESRFLHGSGPRHDPDPPAAALHGARAVLPSARAGGPDPLVPRLPRPRRGGRRPGRAGRPPRAAPWRAAGDL